jgi:hypothetical protein
MTSLLAAKNPTSEHPNTETPLHSSKKHITGPSDIAGEFLLFQDTEDGKTIAQQSTLPTCQFLMKNLPLFGCFSC